MNFNDVTNLGEAQAKTWSIIGTLSHEVYRAGVQYFDNQLLVFSAYSSRYSDDVQIFDLGTTKTTTYPDVINHGGDTNGLIFPVSYVTNSSVTILGGLKQDVNYVEQSGKLNDIGSVWGSKAATETVFKGLLYTPSTSDTLSFANIFI